MSSPRATPCIFYLRGACSFGDACRNSHGNPLSPPGGSPTCPYFLRGRCRFGDQCREFHPPSEQLTSNGQEALSSASPCWHFKRGSCTKGDNCAFSHGEILPSIGDSAQSFDWRDRRTPYVGMKVLNSGKKIRHARVLPLITVVQIPLFRT
ncbi:hypothetical protein B0H10DRAFT_986077 [Mycena sp. CBHHK59/15]|nr:hypothetical protein B0H10DRAFT_986077 [Mycena sp. CBHHK59/15]